MLHRLRPALVLGALALLALPAAASARSFEATYPRAARICAAVAAGQPPARLAGKTTQATAACNALKASFACRQHDVHAAWPRRSTRRCAAIGANARAACAAALAARNPRACRAALAAARAALRPLLDAWRTAARAQRSAIIAAGNTFADDDPHAQASPAARDGSAAASAGGPGPDRHHLSAASMRGAGRGPAHAPAQPAAPPRARANSDASSGCMA